MYKIGDFSKITKLTVKALRYYDEEKLLTPSYRNEENGYRFYGEEDFKRAEFIVLLRELDFSISEIRDILGNCEDRNDLSYFLREKQEMLKKQIRRQKELLKKMDLYISSDQTEVHERNYEVLIKNIASVAVASVRFKGKYSDVGKYMGKIYKAVKSKANGAPFNCYFDSEYSEDADIELCVPISGAIGNTEVATKNLPEIKAICTTHTGSYEGLNRAYKAVLDYAASHHLQCFTPSREIYIKGPGMIFRGNPDKYVTEIVVPIED
jgi:DNA-binding transcriptional MerR regulator